MKKQILLSVILLMGVLNAFSQSQILDLSKGTGKGITLNGKTLNSGPQGGDYVFATQDFGLLKGIKLVLSNFKKLDENANNSICSLNVYYKDESGEEKKASMSFWVQGRKDIRFSSFKSGNEELVIIPEKITKIAIGMGANKEVDITIESVVKK